MTFDEFVKKAKETAHVNMTHGEEYDGSKYSSHRKVTKKGGPAIGVNWCTGGISGGSCWDEGYSHHYALYGETPPEFTSFENLILCFVPNISFVDFRDVRNSVVKTREWTEHEYYGNSTNHAEMYAYLEDIYNWLRTKKFV